MLGVPGRPEPPDASSCIPEGTLTPEASSVMKPCWGRTSPPPPPQGLLLTKIFHRMWAPNGEICVNVLKRGLTAELGIPHGFW